MQIMYDRNLGLTDRMTCLSLALGILVGLFAVLTMLITGVDWRATLLTAILVLGAPTEGRFVPLRSEEGQSVHQGGRKESD